MEIYQMPTSKTLLGSSIIIYLRSAAPNEKEIDRQKEACMQLVDQQNSIIIATINEDGISGNIAIGMRPGLTQAIEICEAGMADIFICHSLDRLSRNPIELLNLIDRLQHAEVGLETVVEGDIFSHPRYLALREMYTAVDLLEREHTNAHASRGQKRRNKQKKLGHPTMENLRLFEE